MSSQWSSTASVTKQVQKRSDDEGLGVQMLGTLEEMCWKRRREGERQ